MGAHLSFWTLQRGHRIHNLGSGQRRRFFVRTSIIAAISSPQPHPFMRCATRLVLFLPFVVITSSFSAELGVRIRFGLTDNSNTVWDGKVSVAPGAVERIDGWRFEDADRIIDNASWRASTRPLTVRRSNNPKKSAKKKAGTGLSDNGVFLLLTGVTEASVVKIETKQGGFQFRLSDIPHGR